MADQVLTNAPNPTTEDVSDLLSRMKQLIEGLQPDLRMNFKPEFDAEVLAVHDDDSDPDSHYTVDVRIAHGGTKGSDLDLPNVPVMSLWAESGYGIYALPEEGSTVSVAFDNWDIRRPRIVDSRYKKGEAPTGFRAGTFAIRGKQGQKIEMKPGANEIVLSSASYKLITTAKRQEHTVGDKLERVQGNEVRTVDGAERLTCDNWTVKVDRAASFEAASFSEKISGNHNQQVGGELKQSIGGAYRQAVAGSASVATAFNKKEVVGGSYEMIVAGTPGIAPVVTPGPTGPQFAAYKVLANLGGLALDCLGGQVDIGANMLAPPTMVNIGGAAAGPVQLGGIPAAGQPAVYGPVLLTMMTQLLAALTTPLQIGNMGAPTIPNPAFVSQIVTLQGMLSTLLSTRVFIAK